MCHLFRGFYVFWLIYSTFFHEGIEKRHVIMDTVFCSGRDMTTPLTNWYDSFHPVSSALCWNITSECREVQCFLFFFKAKGIITVMTLGLKKPEIDCKISRQSCICSHLISIFFQSPKLGYITSRYKSKKKIMNHTWLWLCNKKRNSSLKFNIHNAPHAKSEVSSFHS